MTAPVALADSLRLLDGLHPTAPLHWIWWDVTEPALVLSRGSRVQPDREQCRALGVHITRRGSGGGPVRWSADLLALDVFVPRDHPLWSPDVVESYRWLGEAIADGLRAAGIAAEALPPARARATNDPGVADRACFGGRSPWEVVVDGRKLVGLSQVRRTPGLLLQAGILRRAEGARLTELLDLPFDERMALAQTLTTSTVGLDELGADAAAATTAVERAVRHATDQFSG